MEKDKQAKHTKKNEVSKEVTLTEYDHKKIDNDIKYCGPLSYRYLRLIGWITLAIMFVSIVLSMSFKLKSAIGEVSESTSAVFETVLGIMSYFSALPLPLFLIANFAIILQNKNNYKKLIWKYGKILLLIYLGFIAVYYHYIVILLMRLSGLSFLQARQISVDLFTILGKQSGLVVNVFVDLFCCVLIMFFIDYTPKKYFQGKKLIIFRLFFLLPMLYEVTSAILMGLLGMNALVEGFSFSLPPELLPLIGKKPIGMIIAFVIICFYIKIRDKLYLKKGGTPEGLKEYQMTNRNSFRFSLNMSLIFLIVAIVDLFVIIIIGAILETKYPSDINLILSVLSNFTLGKSVCLILVIPFILLFSYTKQHQNNKMDQWLPIVGIGLVVFAIIETLFFSLLF